LGANVNHFIAVTEAALYAAPSEPDIPPGWIAAHTGDFTRLAKRLAFRQPRQDFENRGFPAGPTSARENQLRRSHLERAFVGSGGSKGT
jgi:hypothetical protein